MFQPKLRSAARALPGAALSVALFACSQPPLAESPAPEPVSPPPPPSAAAAEPPTPAAQAPAAEAPEKASARPVHWGYVGDVDPAHWATLSPAYEACGAGVMQSPVDIPAKGAQKGEAFAFSYGNAKVTVAHHEHVDDIVDNGHTIQVTVDEGATLTTAKATYSLKQFHFHTPSENKVNGKSFPMEAHFVHQSEKGDFAVVAVFFEAGRANDNLQKLIEHFPSKGEKTALDGALDLSLHVPPKGETFHFLGSFTTPPCTENVEWIVYRQPVQASRAQIEAFAQKLGSNNRPTQDFRARPLSSSQLRAGGS